MNVIKKQYITNITWSTIETIGFQSLLFLHQYMLFRVTEAHFYGLVGMLFGLIYFNVKLCDFGFSKIITSCFIDYAIDRKTTRQFLTKQLIPSTVLYGIIVTIIFFARNIFTHYQSIVNLNYYILFLLVMVIAIEITKMLTKKILQASHHFRQIAFFEIFFMICYLCIIWSYYYTQQVLTLYFVFGSFFIVSTMETLGLLILAYQWYLSLPLETKNTSDQLSYFTITKNRLFSYCHSMGKQIFSANILVPLSAYFFGLECAALLKLASYLTHGIIVIIEKIIDPSSAVLFAHTKNDHIKSKQDFFSLASYILYNILICVLIFVSINYAKILNIQNASTTTLTYIFIYFFIHYIETFFIIIEKFFIAHDKSEFLIINTLFNGLLVVIAFFYALSPTIALLYLVTTRLLSFYIAIFILSSLWNIKHKIVIAPSYVIVTIITSLAFFMFF